MYQKMWPSKKRPLTKEIYGYIELDAQFHDIIAKLSGSDRLLELVQTLRRHMLRYRTHVVYAFDTAIRWWRGTGVLLMPSRRGYCYGS